MADKILSDEEFATSLMKGGPQREQPEQSDEAFANSLVTKPQAPSLSARNTPVTFGRNNLSKEEHEFRQVMVEGTAQNLEEDLAPEIILGAAFAPALAPAFGLGLARWGAAGVAGRIGHATLDGALALGAEYGYVRPLAKTFGGGNPYTEFAIEMMTGVGSAVALEGPILNYVSKVFTKSAPKFWTNTVDNLIGSGSIPKETEQALKDLARNSDLGDTEATKKLIEHVRELSYNKTVSHYEKKTEALAKAKTLATESTEETIEAARKRTATSGSLAEEDIEKLAIAAERDTIGEYVPEYDKMRTSIISERAKEVYEQHPNRDVISLIAYDGGISEDIVRGILKDPDEAKAAIKALSKHEGLITQSGKADIGTLSEMLGVRNPKKLIQSLANTPGLNKIKRSIEHELRGEFEDIYKNEIFVRTAQKHTDYLMKVIGHEPPPVLRKPGIVKELSKGKNIGRVVDEIVELKDTIRRFGDAMKREGAGEASEVASKRRDKLIQDHKTKLEELSARVKIAKEVKKIHGFLKNTFNKSEFLHPEYREHLQQFLGPLFNNTTPYKSAELPETMYEFLTRKYKERFSFGSELIAQKYSAMLLSIGARPRNLSDLTFDQLQDINDFVKAFKLASSAEKYMDTQFGKIWTNALAGNIAAQASTTAKTSKFLQQKAAREIEGALQKAKRLEAKKGEPIEAPAYTPRDSVEARKRSTSASSAILGDLKRMERVFEQLDGWEKFGLAWTHGFLPLKNAEALEQRLSKMVFDKYEAILKSYSKAVGKSAKKVLGQELPSIGVEKVDRKKLIVMALNSGNDYNLEVLTKHLNGGLLEKTTDEVTSKMVKEYLNTHMTKADWEYVENIWKLMDEELFPVLSKAYKEVTGETLKRVKGRYYPVVPERYTPKDPNMKPQDIIDALTGPVKQTKATIRKQMIETRTGGTERLDLSMDPMIRHMVDSIHLATHWKAIQDVTNLTKNEVFRQAVINTMGEATYNQFDLWIRNIARPSAYDPAHKIMESIMRKARSAITIGYLGLRITTGLKQSLSLLTAIPEVGIINTAAATTRMVVNPVVSAVGKLMNNPIGMIRMINEASSEMAHRSITWQREINEIYQQNIGKMNSFKGYALKTAFYFIHAIDTLTASTVWQAAYTKALHDMSLTERQAAAFADNIVNKTQPASSAKDLPRVMRDTENKRWVSMFYSYYSVWHNQVAEIMNKGLSGNMSKFEMLSTLAYLTASPVVGWGIVGYAGHKVGSAVLGREDIDDTEYIKEVARELGVAPFAGVPILRDMATAAIMGYEAELTPVAEIPKLIGKNLKSAFDFITDDDDEFERQEMLNAAKLGAFAFGLPANQLVTTLEAAIRLSEGETSDYSELLIRRNRNQD